MATELVSPTRAAGDGGAMRTIAALWQNAIAAEHAAPAYLVEAGADWREVTWREAAERVDDLGHGLLALGIRKGDAFAILAQTQLDWAFVDFALALVGAVGVPIYANSSQKDCAYILDHAEAIGVFVEDDGQLAKVEAAKAELPRLAHVIAFAELDTLAERGREHRQAHPTALADAAAAIDEDDLYTYLYTSGTTGFPKACMIRHRNYHAMVTTIDRLDGFTIAGDVMLLYLPLAHNFGRLMHLVGPYVGYTVAFLPDPQRLPEALPRVRPTVLPSVPRVYEKVHTAVTAQFEAATGAKRRLIDWALEVGSRASVLRLRGEPLPRSLSLQHRLADRLVYSKIKDRLGGRLRIGISGGAPLAEEIGAFFHRLDILILEGYGLSECTTAATVNRPDRVRFGTVGPALPEVELRIADDGEILIRSQTVFAGYYRDEPSTRATLTDDGWLLSGDIGELDADGFLRITDRKKDILVTAGGKNVAPQSIENALKAATLVSQALVVGDRRPYVTALLTLDPDAVSSWAGSRGLPLELDVLAGRPELERELQAAVDEVNRERSRYEQIKCFAVLPRDFELERDEITPTLKLRRRVCEQHFADEIEALYR